MFEKERFVMAELFNSIESGKIFNNVFIFFVSFVIN